MTQSTGKGLFTELAPLLLHRAVLITVSRLGEGDGLQVNICPRQLKEGENQALTTPLCITGTPAELDSELVVQISGFVTSHVGLNINLAAIEKELAEAEKAAREEAKKKQKVVGNGGRKAADTGTASQALSPPEPEPPRTLNLFDQAPETVEEAPPETVSQATAAAV